MTVARLGRAHGVRGAVRVRSFTEPEEALLGYRPWLLRGERGWEPCEVVAVRSLGPGAGFAARLAGVDDREGAERLAGVEVAVPRDRLPEPAPGEWYWCDLVGLAVEDLSGRALGEVERIMETGANDVLVVRGDRERLVPFVPGPVVASVDTRAGRIVVDWDPDF